MYLAKNSVWLELRVSSICPTSWLPLPALSCYHTFWTPCLRLLLLLPGITHPKSPCKLFLPGEASESETAFIVRNWNSHKSGLNTQAFIVSHARNLEEGSSGMAQWLSEVISAAAPFSFLLQHPTTNFIFNVQLGFKMTAGAPVITSPF